MRIPVNDTSLQWNLELPNSSTTTTTTTTTHGIIPTINTVTHRASNIFVKSNLSRNLKVVINSTISRKYEHDHGPVIDGGNGDDDDDSNNTVLVALSVLGIVLVVLAMCCLLCYREISRRRLENGILMEKARREMLRNAIKSKVEEMKNVEQGDDTESYMAVMELKVPLVTFGKVTMISPVPSTESMQSVLDRHLHRHHHHHHHHHHYHKLDKKGEDDVGIVSTTTSISISSSSSSSSSCSSTYDEG